jgi:hypothetical protein
MKCYIQRERVKGSLKRRCARADPRVPADNRQASAAIAGPRQLALHRWRWSARSGRARR